MIKNSPSSSPIFARALADSWSCITPEVKEHYNLTPRTDDEIVLQGVMSVSYPRLAIVLLAPVRLFGGLALLRQKNIPVEVKNFCLEEREAMFWQRVFTPANSKNPVMFHSSMEYAGGREVIEYMGQSDYFKIGVKMAVKEKEGAIHYISTAYLIKIGSFKIPIPGHFLLGRARIFEKATADKNISMGFTIRHPLWGEIYSYFGEFKILPLT